MYFIYELIDPRTDTTGYIGITNNPNQRYCEHIEGRVGKGKKYEWIRCMQEERVQPKMKILEIVEDLDQARRQERHWVQYYISKGIELTNILLCNKENEETDIMTRETNSARKVIQNRSHPSKDELPFLDNYYTKNQVRKILDIDYNTFYLFIRKGLITNTIPDRQSQVSYYLKSDIDKLATDLEEFRKKHGPEKLIPQTILRRKEQ